MDVLSAVVQKVIPNGQHGPYAVATSDKIEGSVTFSLKYPVWRENRFPEPGNIVMLSDLDKKRSGWRSCSVRFYTLADEKNSKSARSIVMDNKKSEKKVRQILQPLDGFVTQSTEYSSFGCSWSTQPESYMSHGYYVLNYVLPHLEDAVKRWGIYVVARELVEASLPAYEKVDKDAMASFWSMAVGSVISLHFQDEVPEERRNSAMMAKHGVKKYLTPILELAIVHQETNVFSRAHKYMGTHAMRIGEAASRLKFEDYLQYIEFAKMLLQNGIYDWSIELGSEDWRILTADINRYGIKRVMQPIVDAMIATKDIPGLQEVKYHYSYMFAIARNLYPYMSSLTEDHGVDAYELVMDIVVQFVRELYKAGAFSRSSHWGEKVTKFIDSFVVLSRPTGAKKKITDIHNFIASSRLDFERLLCQ